MGSPGCVVHVHVHGDCGLQLLLSIADMVCLVRT